MRAFLIAASCASWVCGCACSPIGNGGDGGTLDGSTDAALLDVRHSDVPRLDAPCAESIAATATGRVIGGPAERFTEARFDVVDCDGAYQLNTSLYEAGMPLDGPSITVGWFETASLHGPEPVRGLDVPVSVAWGSRGGPGGSVTAMMHVQYADPLYSEGPHRLMASLSVDSGSDQFELSFDFTYCSFMICL